MQPGLKEGDQILIADDVKELKRGDIVLYHYPADQKQNFISRIIGLPNEEVEVKEGRVFVDGKVLSEPYVSPDNNRSGFGRPPVKVPEGRYYVMGDNRDNSNDSRLWGPLTKEFIYGKLVGKY